MRKALILLILFGLIMPMARGRQSSTTISYDQPVAGTITADSFRHLYAFNGREGDVITIRLTAPDGDLDPYLLLLDRNGQLIAYDDNRDTDDSAQIESLRLPASGSYFVVVTRFGHEHGTTSGAYNLLLERLGSTVQAGATLAFGDRVNHEISAEQPQVVYFFEARRGQVINIHMQRSSGNLDSFLMLADYATRQILVEQDDDPGAIGNLNARIVNYVVPATGVYVIVATRYGQEAGTTSGRFVLSLTETPQASRGRAINEPILLDYGMTASGELSAEVSQRYYSFEGRRGEVVTISMQRTTGNLDTLVLLLDSNRQEIARGDTARNPQIASIPAVSLPADGEYTIMVARQDFAEGRTAGTYDLTLAGRPGISATGMLEVFYDVPVEGVITDGQPFENYVFQGEAGDYITIRMERTSGDLDALLTVYLDGKQLVFDDDSGETDKNALIRRFRLPEDGIYQIEAARFDRAAGSTTGTYRLILEKR